MKPDRSVDLDTLDFRPLSEAKAHLSELVKDLAPNRRRVIITVNGRPAAALIAFDELARALAPAPVVSLEAWRADRPNRERARDSILELFDVTSLSRKGQKRYKREKVRALRR